MIDEPGVWLTNQCVERPAGSFGYLLSRTGAVPVREKIGGPEYRHEYRPEYRHEYRHEYRPEKTGIQKPVITGGNRLPVPGLSVLGLSVLGLSVLGLSVLGKGNCRRPRWRPWQRRGVVCLLALALSACTAIVRPNFEPGIVDLREGQYQLDARHSFVHFKVPHLGLSTYVGRFNTFSASLDFDPRHLAGIRLEGIVELGSVDTGDAEVDELLAEPGWFDVARFPQAVFKTTAVEDLGNNELLINGELTLRGVTQPVVLNGRFNGGADNLLTRRYTIGFAASGRFSRSGFGMDRFAGLVGDEVVIELFAEFLRNP